MYSLLEKEIGYTFNNKAILAQALTHASKSRQHLERQEFLGDAVLGLVIAEYLYIQHPDSAEGDLSKMRANLVCKPALLHIAKRWDLVVYLNVGDGERDARGRLKSESIAANAVESVIGAVFLDAGWSQAKQVVIQAWQHVLKDVKPINLRDAKSELQELTQSHGFGVPQYQVADLGMNREPRFKAQCLLNDSRIGEGFGGRKKHAEIAAAQDALAGETLRQIITSSPINR